MKNHFYSLCIFFLLGAIGLQAQVRYLDEVFSEVSVTADVSYGNNISVLEGPLSVQPLLMDVYSPAGDEASARAVVICLHTGSFLPQYLNGQVTGGKRDSAVVQMCTRLARMGYVAIAATYRQGWNPTATGAGGQNIRTGTLLNAAYRGIQDLRTCIRYLRKTVAEDANSYRINPDKIAVIGQGTGGYISSGAAFLDDFAEVQLDKFIDLETSMLYVDTNLVGNLYGTTEKPLCIPNWPSYSSDFQLAVSLAGALGDASWIDGPTATANEPAYIGVQIPTDPFTPFGNGPVIVPTTGDFVVNVSGSRTAVDTANMKGVNDVLASINLFTNTLNQKVQANKNVPFQFPGQTATTLAAENVYPLITPGYRIEAAPWDWYDISQMEQEVASFNQSHGTSINPATLQANTLLTNPNMSRAKGLAYIDTVLMFYTPRACAALGLTECLDALGVVSVQELGDDHLVEMQVGPNPAGEEIHFRTSLDHPMEEIRVFNLNGLMVQAYPRINSSQHTMSRRNLPPGIYLARIRFKEGILTRKIIFH